MDYLDKERARELLFQVGDKFFYRLKPIAGLFGAGRPAPVVKNYDKKALANQAIKQHPEARYFAMIEDFTAFIPDDKHVWSGLLWEEAAA